MVSLFHRTSPWTHTCLQSSPRAHRNGRVFRRLVQTACCYWILNHGKSSSNWISQMNANHLWWLVCWYEYSKTLGKAVQRWRVGASTFEWQNAKYLLVIEGAENDLLVRQCTFCNSELTPLSCIACMTICCSVHKSALTYKEIIFSTFSNQ